MYVRGQPLNTLCQATLCQSVAARVNNVGGIDSARVFVRLWVCVVYVRTRRVREELTQV